MRGVNRMIEKNYQSSNVKNFGNFVVCFFFQAEDGIRDYKVTGVQTCALPISLPLVPPRLRKQYLGVYVSGRLGRL